MADTGEGGPELTGVGGAIVAMFDRLAPLSLVGPRKVELAAYEGIAAKVRRGESLSDVEQEFVAASIGSSAKKQANLTRIVNLSRNYVAASQPAGLLPAGSPGNPSDEAFDAPSSTSEDWFDKFREDAGLVSDEVIQDLYARVLADEAQTPGEVPLRVLGVMRYLDRETAEAFANVTLCGFEGKVAACGTKGRLHEHLGINLEMMSELEAAGLLTVGAMTYSTFSTATARVIRLFWHEKVVYLRRKSGEEFKLEYSTYGFTAAGRQIAKAVRPSPNSVALDLMVRWLVEENAVLGGRVTDLEAHVADLPHRNWTGPIGELAWVPWKP